MPKALTWFYKYQYIILLSIGEKNNMIVLGVLYEYSSTEVANTEIIKKLEQEQFINAFLRNSMFLM